MGKVKLFLNATRQSTVILMSWHYDEGSGQRPFSLAAVIENCRGCKDSVWIPVAFPVLRLVVAEYCRVDVLSTSVIIVKASLAEIFYEKKSSKDSRSLQRSN